MFKSLANHFGNLASFGIRKPKSGFEFELSNFGNLASFGIRKLQPACFLLKPYFGNLASFGIRKQQKEELAELLEFW